MEDNLNLKKKYNDDLIKMKEKWKTTHKNKMEDEPIIQNQPNWLWHHRKFT